MKVLQSNEIDVISGGMGSRGYVNQNQDPCTNAVMGGAIGGGIAGSAGGFVGLVLGFFGGGFGGYISA